MTFSSHPQWSRRQILQSTGMGFGGLALASLLQQQGVLHSAAYGATSGSDVQNPLSSKPPHFAPRVKRIVHLFMNGGPSQVDTFDPKPMLTKYNGKALPSDSTLRTERATGAAMGSPFKFSKHGKSGIDVSDLFPNVAESADELCVIRSMHTDVPNHEPSLMMMNCGDSRLSRPSVGSWVLYGLGTENQNLPGYVVLCPGGRPTAESSNWRSSFLPGIYQGNHIDTEKTKVEDLIANINNPFQSARQQRAQLDLIQKLNAEHRTTRQYDPNLEARIQSFELAFGMQMEASDAFDVSQEPEMIREMYGEDLQGRQMMIARRLLERGVRYVQVYHGNGQPWDSHNNLQRSHERLAKQCDQAIGALLKDLKQRGMLEDTLVIWGGEFGRTPVVEVANSANPKASAGRDHNNHGFSMWMAGGGVKKGFVYGKTDDFGFKAVENRVHVHDLHATILHLLGFDHKQLTYRYAGRDFRLTDVHGHVVHDILA
ncbi:Arylsulfatase A [Planctomycetales bacterium 10988]|nr:Arylsulfatase A [Planctomycetales bacterium 10988]